MVSLGVEERTPIGRGIGKHGHRVAGAAIGFNGIGVEHPLGLAGLAGDHGDGVGCGGADDGVHEVIEEQETVGVAPHERCGVAVDVRHDQFAKLLALERRDLGGLAILEGDAFFRERVAIVARNAVGINVEFMGDADVGVIDRGDVGRVERDGLAVRIDHGEGDFEGRDAADGAVEVDDGLGEAGDGCCGMRVEAFGTGVGGEVEVEGAVLLEEDEDVLHLFAEQLELGVVREDGFAGGRDGEALDGGTGGRSDVGLCRGGLSAAAGR